MKSISRRSWIMMFCATSLLLIAIGVTIAVQARKKIVESAFTFDVIKENKVGVSYDNDINNVITYDPDANAGYDFGNFRRAKKNITMQEVYERADIIVKAEATNDRAFEYRSILNKMIVTEIYKGDQSLISSEIYVYEYMYPDFQLMLQTYSGGDGYNIMNTGDEYYLFLSRRPMPDGYIFTEKDKKTYLLTNVHMGKYKVVVCKDMKVLTPSEVIIEDTREFLSASPDYQNVKDWDILPMKSEQLVFYLSHRKEALELLKIVDNQQ